MKKIVLLSGVLVALNLLTTSCLSELVEEEKTVTPPPVVKDTTLFHVSASIENSDIKDIHNISSAEIGLFLYNSDYNSGIQRNRGVSLSSGYTEFDPSTNYSSAYCFGYYPYSSDLTGSYYKGVLPAVQSQSISTSTQLSGLPGAIKNNLLMLSGNSESVNFEDEVAKIQFRHVFSLLRFDITHVAGFSEFANQRIRNFRMYISRSSDIETAMSKKLAGDYALELKNAAASGNLTPIFSPGEREITAQITNSPVINATTPAVIWIAVPPFSLAADERLVVRMETDNGGEISFTTISSFTSSEIGAVSRSLLKPIPVKLDKEQAYSDDVIKEEITNPANSYIISESGTYTIPVKTVTGNTITGGNNAAWLWASKSGGGNTFSIDELIRNISYDDSQKKIKFTVGQKLEGFNEGNVVLALRDASGNIVWTWHLWLTEIPGEIAYEGEHIFMDRNMGALSPDVASSSIDTYGFMYQWGRKDPFFGGSGHTYDEALNVFGVANANTIVNTSVTWASNANKWHWEKRASYGTKALSEKYPMCFIYNEDDGSQSWEDNPADWLQTSNSDRWSGIAKTDYDPCPHGYRVPDKNELASMYERADELGLEYKTNRYWQYKYIDVTSLWPAAGMRQGRQSSSEHSAQLKYSGTEGNTGRCYYWTATPLDLAGFTGGSYRVFTNNEVLYSKDDYGDNADAYPVRCVEE